MKHFLTLVLFALASVSYAEETDGTDQDDSNVDAKPKLICTREQVSGSHMKQRVCRTQHQIDIMRQEVERLRDADNTLKARQGES